MMDVVFVLWWGISVVGYCLMVDGVMVDIGLVLCVVKVDLFDGVVCCMLGCFDGIG